MAPWCLVFFLFFWLTLLIVRMFERGRGVGLLLGLGVCFSPFECDLCEVRESVSVRLSLLSVGAGSLCICLSVGSLAVTSLYEVERLPNVRANFKTLSTRLMVPPIMQHTYATPT